MVNPDRASASVVQNTLARVSLQSQVFDTPSRLLGVLPLRAPACVVFDFFMPDINGLQLIQNLRYQDCFHPCILTASRLDGEHYSQAMKQGAFAVIKRPFQQLELIETIQAALAKHQAIYPLIEEALNYRKRREQLSEREKRVLMFLEKGMSAKAVSDELRLSHRTVENHRMRIFKKLQIKNTHSLIAKVTSLDVLRACGVLP